MSRKNRRGKFTDAELAYWQQGLTGQDRTPWLTKREPEMAPLHSLAAQRVFESALAEVVSRRGSHYDACFDIDGADHLKTIQVAYTGGHYRIWSINGGKFMPEGDGVGGFLGHISIMVAIDEAMAGKTQPGARKATYDTTRLADELRAKVAAKQLPFSVTYDLVNGPDPVSVLVTGNAESGCITWVVGSSAHADNSSSSWDAIKHALDRAIHGY